MMAPLGGAHELDAAADRLAAGYNLPRERHVALLRGAADSLRLLSGEIARLKAQIKRMETNHGCITDS